MVYLNDISKLCRLCCQDSDCGFDIFIESEVKASLVILINKYLPIKVYEDDMLPKQICETCHVGVATTVDLIDRMVEGQHRLRTLCGQYIKKVENTQHYKNPPVKHEVESIKVPVNKNSEFKAPIDAEVDDSIISPKLNIIKESVEAVGTKEEKSVIGQEVLSIIDKLGISQVEVMTPESKKMEYRHSTQVLINIQGGTPDIEMNDLAKGINVKKIYESHQLCQAMEGFQKKKRGRRRIGQRVNNEMLSKSKSGNDIELDCKGSIASGRPKRKTNVPSRYRDSIAENEFEDILTDDVETDVGEFNIDIEKHNIEFSEFNFLSNKEEKKTHVLEDTTVVVTSNHRDEATLKLPAAVNIELDFNEESSTTKDSEGNDISRIDHTPKASVLTVKEMPKVKFLPPMISSGLRNEGHKTKFYLQNFRRKKFTRRKKMFSCEYCNKKFVHEGRYFYHLKLHNNVTLICEACNEQFQQNVDLKAHQTATGHSGMGILENENTDENKVYKCGICPERKFFSILAYKKHQRAIHYGTKPYSCPICLKTYVSLQNRNLHYSEAHRQEHSAKRFPCEECGKVFVQQSSLTYHIDSHHVAGRKFVCKICGKAFKHKQLLQRHYFVHSEERPHLCSYCKKSFKTKGNLDNHMNLHTHSKVFTCETCGKQFNHITALTQHRRMHTGEKPFECLHCGKRFVQTGNLQEHLRIHTGEKPYCCQECGKKFTTSSQMKLHEKRHKKDLKFRCSFCPKGFLNQEFWLSHEAKHRGDKRNFQCATCQKTFSEKGAYQKHLKSHLLPTSYGNTYECAVCNKLFSSSSSCIRHMNKHVGTKAEFVNAYIEQEPVSIDSSVVRRSTQPSTNPEIVYVFSKKDGNELDNIYFGNEIFTPDPNQPAVENITIGQLPNSFICDATAARSNCQILVENENATFEVSIKAENSQVIMPEGVGMFEPCI